MGRFTGMPIFSATCRWLYTGGLEMMACAVKGSPPVVHISWHQSLL